LANITLDTLALSRTQGTGLTTFSRNLAKALQELGYSVNGLAGAPANTGGALPKDVALLDANLPQAGLGPLGKLQNSLQLYRTRFRDLRQHPTATPIAFQTVDTRYYPHLSETFAQVYHVSDLFQRAYYCFSKTGKLWEVQLPAECHTFHASYPLPFRIRNARLVASIHDLIPLALPSSTLDNKGTHFRLLSTLCQTADKLSTLSQFVKDELIRTFPVNPEKIVVTTMTTDIPAQVQALSEADLQAILQQNFGLHFRQYFVFLSALAPHKNLTRLLSAYLTLPSALPLIIIGKDGWLVEEQIALLKQIEALPAGKKVIRLGYLPRELMLLLVRGARMLLSPSLYEGFGVPALEAMTLGTPVLASNTTALPEVCGPAAEYVDPYSIESIRAGLLSAQSESRLADLRTAGIAQAKTYSLERYTERLRALYAS
jgi:glycosyltransferase involved in cell wall biosynthesis